MFELSADFPSELVPLSWLVGSWHGTGVVSFSPPKAAEGADAANTAGLSETSGAPIRLDSDVEYEFEQRLTFEVEGTSVLRYEAVTSRLVGGDLVASERGYWRLVRPAQVFDSGPGLVSGVGGTTFTSAESVESLRNDNGSFDIEAVIAHPDGIAELYVGTVDGPRIDLATDAVMRPESAREYRAATRMFGLVEGHLLWVWDAAALGGPLRSMASARLARD